MRSIDKDCKLAKNLPKKQFTELKAHFKGRYNDPSKVHLFLTTMALHDLGKVAYIKLAATGGLEKTDFDLHDDILLKLLQERPELLATFYLLPKS